MTVGRGLIFLGAMGLVASAGLMACAGGKAEVDAPDTAASAAMVDPNPTTGRNGNPAANPETQAINPLARRVEVATIKTSSASLQIELPGEIEGIRDAVLASALGGFVEKVHVQNGQRVRQGQPLARIDATTHLARLAQAKVELDSAEREWNRAEQLGDTISSLEKDTAESRLAGAKAAFATAKIQVDRAVVRAPFRGVISGLDLEPGEIAAPGAPILRLVQMNRVKVSIAVPDRDVVTLQEGIRGSVHTDAQGTAFEGEITHIDPAANINTRAFTVELTVENQERKLRPGMIATVRIQQPIGADELLIPQDWVVTGVDALGVFLEQEGTAHWSPIELGRVIRNQVVVRSGIGVGSRVVTKGHRELVDGDPIMVSREGVCCESGRATYTK